MKTSLVLLLATASLPVSAFTTINPVDRFAYGANFGWINWRGDGPSGAVIGAFVCSGFVYSANAGWIHLGDGTPANGASYQNNSANDYGVNHDGAGRLHGFAYGANIGWLTFTNRASNGAVYDGPRVDLVTGQLCGYVWSANCGWISLCNAQAFVKTDRLDWGGDADGDGLPDQWERRFAANLGVLNGAGDTDHDGLTDAQEFAADTNPFDADSILRITNITKPVPSSPVRLTWTSSPARQYRILGTEDLTSPLPWLDVGFGLNLGDPGEFTTRSLPATAHPNRFYVIEAILPLSP